MTGEPLNLPWWPPAPEEPIGEARAEELVRRLREIAPPVVQDAERDLRARLGPTEETIRSGAPASYLARTRFASEMQSVCVGTVYQVRGNPATMNSLQLHRDGVLRWRRE